MDTDNIITLADHQLRDPQRGGFRVNVSPCKSPRYYRGERVHVDAYGVKFIVGQVAPVAQVAI